MKPNLIFDGQLLQTNAWHRGMGRYNLQLLHNLSESYGQYFNISIIFNDNIKTEAQRLKVIKFFCPSAKQVHADLPVATDRFASELKYKKRLDHLIKKEFPEGENYYILTSLFSFDFFAAFPDQVKKVLLLYDLTPLLFWRDLGAYFPPHLYMHRFNRIYEADKILTISATTRNDVLKIFGFEPDLVVNINGGFTKPNAKIQQPAGFSVPKKYILFVSGDLPHKNNEMAVTGFAQYIKNAKTDLKLVITSTFSKKSQQKLQKICPDTVFSDNVLDEELEWLYEHAEAILFASKYEGLGIPILDAIYNDKPVIASKILVFEEMSSSSFYYFAPDKVEELSSAITEAIAKKSFAKKQSHYTEIMEKYSWSNTAAGFTKALPQTARVETNKPSNQKLKKIAVLAIYPGINQQIGRLAEPLHYYLAQNYKIDYYFDSCGLGIKQFERPTFLDELGAKVADIMEMTHYRYKRYDEIVYLLDDFSLSFKIAQFASVLPGVAVYQLDKDQLYGELNTVKKVILANQKESLTFHKLPSVSELASKLDNYWSKSNEQSAEELIIRQGYSNSAIIKGLLSRITNDK